MKKWHTSLIVLLLLATSVSGQIGINTDSPVGLLDAHIEGTFIHMRMEKLGTSSMKLTSTAALGLQSSSSSHIEFRTGDKNLARIYDGTYKFVVDGIIASEGFHGQNITDWPDFVFKSNYPLMPLSEVQSFININGHLPDVPSAETIEENGVELVEMNMILLQKIEELTLHLIKQEKEITELKEKVRSLTIE